VYHISDSTSDMRKKSELIFNAILPFVDFLAIVSAFILAYIIRVKIDGRPVPNPIGSLLFLKIFLLVLPVWIFIFALLGLYNLSNVRRRLEEWGRVFVGVSGGTMFLIMVDFFSRHPIFPSRSIPIYGYIFSFVFVIIGRSIVRLIQHWLFRFGVGIHQVLLVGSGPIAVKLYQHLSRPKSGYHVAAIYDRVKISQNNFKKTRKLVDLEEISALRPAVEEILQADSALPPDEVLELINYANSHHISYRFVPNQFGLFATNSKILNLGGEQVIEIQRTPLEGWGRILKRLFDCLGAGLALIIFSPVFLAIIIAIKLTDRGPSIYRHRRLSRSGNYVNVFKFRSMYSKYSTGPGHKYKTAVEVFTELGRDDLVKEFKLHQKVANDPRVTPVGRWLRRTSLDELPQLMNVLKGDMSMVGPRPILEEELPRYGKSSAVFLSLKPGLTGLWQISGRSDIGYDDRVKLDIYYVEHWSLWLDIKILIKTISTVLQRGGAY
jgi:exopolysaccharide biosynthesis polyprenyl glycosylphosphotransferase